VGFVWGSSEGEALEVGSWVSVREKVSRGALRSALNGLIHRGELFSGASGVGNKFSRRCRGAEF
jgi:hypothetical protein